MSVKSKKKLAFFSKGIMLLAFTIVFLFNIRLHLSNDSSENSKDISLFGVEVELFDAIYATTTCTTEFETYGCVYYCPCDNPAYGACCHWECGDNSGYFDGPCY